MQRPFLLIVSLHPAATPYCVEHRRHSSRVAPLLPRRRLRRRRLALLQPALGGGVGGTRRGPATPYCVEHRRHSSRLCCRADACAAGGVGGTHQQKKFI